MRTGVFGLEETVLVYYYLNCTRLAVVRYLFKMISCKLISSELHFWFSKLSELHTWFCKSTFLIFVNMHLWVFNIKNKVTIYILVIKSLFWLGTKISAMNFYIILLSGTADNIKEPGLKPNQIQPYSRFIQDFCSQFMLTITR